MSLTCIIAVCYLLGLLINQVHLVQSVCTSPVVFLVAEYVDSNGSATQLENVELEAIRFAGADEVLHVNTV